MVYLILLKIFMSTDAYVHMKHRNSLQDGQAVVFNVHQQLLGNNSMTRQATEEERKLHSSHYESKKKEWDWLKDATLHKKQYTILESLADHGCSGTDSGTNVCHNLHGVNSTDFEAVKWS